ncbi:MAG: hypothetical protein FD172_4035 [Methylocystaceae bacterium]|nr:MAG: hypothetical protein FD172_4035 [Methylocystaceae bacterium]
MTRQEPWIIYTIAYKSAQRAHQSPVSCREKDVDRYGRIVATCQVRGEDIELWLVRSGHAFAYRRYSSDYIGAEQEAKNNRRGMWAGHTQAPWEWRKEQRHLSR